MKIPFSEFQSAGSYISVGERGTAVVVWSRNLGPSASAASKADAGNGGAGIATGPSSGAVVRGAAAASSDRQGAGDRAFDSDG